MCELLIYNQLYDASFDLWNTLNMLLYLHHIRTYLMHDNGRNFPHIHTFTQPAVHRYNEEIHKDCVYALLDIPIVIDSL